MDKNEHCATIIPHAVQLANSRLELIPVFFTLLRSFASLIKKLAVLSENLINTFSPNETINNTYGKAFGKCIIYLRFCVNP